MGLLKMFRRRPAIRDSDGLGQFISEQAAYLIQKGIYEYARARAGHYAKVLLTEPEFLEAVEQSRWQAYPLGLVMVAEMAEGVLRPRLGDSRDHASQRLRAIVLAVFDQYARPQPFSEERWRDIRDELARKLERLGRHALKSVKDIPEPYAEAYFALMPIHEKLRGRDFSTTRSYLKIALCNIHDELIERIDAPAVAAALAAGNTSAAQ